MIKKIIQRLLILVLLGGAIGGFYYYSIENMEVNDTLYYGEIEFYTYDVFATVPGIIQEVLITEGDLVNVNQEILMLDKDKVLLQYEKAELNKSIADENVTKSNTSASEEEINMQMYSISQLESQRDGIKDSISSTWNLYNQSKIASEGLLATYELQQTTQERIKSLYEAGVETQANMDATTLALTKSKNSYESSLMETSRIFNEINSLENQEIAIEAQISSAQEQLKRLYGGYEDIDKSLTMLNVDLASKELEIIKASLEDYTVKAYNAGRIENIYYEQGEFVNAGSSIATLYDEDKMYTKLYVSEVDLLSLSVEQEIRFKLVSDKSIEITGQIKEIALEAMYTPLNIVSELDRERLVFEVEVELDGNDQVKSGMLIVTDFGELE